MHCQACIETVDDPLAFWWLPWLSMQLYGQVHSTVIEEMKESQVHPRSVPNESACNRLGMHYNARL